MMAAAGRVVGHVPTGGTLSWSEATRDGRTVPVFCLIIKLLRRGRGI